MGGLTGTGGCRVDKDLTVRMPEGELCSRVFLTQENSRGLCPHPVLVGRANHSKGGIIIYHLKELPRVENGQIISFDKTASFEAYNEWVGGLVLNYKSEVWATYDPILQRMGQ